MLTRHEAYPVPVDQSPAFSYLASLSTRVSRKTMRQTLNMLAAILTGAQYDREARRWIGGTLDAFSFPWHTLRYPHVAAVRAVLIENYGPATINRALTGLRTILRTCWRMGLMSADDYHKASDVRSVPNDALPTGRSLSSAELKGLIDACKTDDDLVGARDAAIIAVLYSCGLRRAELINLRMEHYDPSTGRLIVFRGKGNKSRTVYITGNAQVALEAWLARRGPEPGYIFTYLNNGQHVRPESHIWPNAIRDLLNLRGSQAGLKHFTIHDLRRTHISDLLDRGVDIATVARLAGHVSVITTARYDRRGEEVKRKAASTLDFPY